MANKSIRLTDGTNNLYPEGAVTGSNSNGTYIKFALFLKQTYAYMTSMHEVGMYLCIGWQLVSGNREEKTDGTK